MSNLKLDFDLGFNSHTQYKSYDLLKLSKEIRNFSSLLSSEEHKEREKECIPFSLLVCCSCFLSNKMGYVKILIVKSKYRFIRCAFLFLNVM